VLLDGDVYLTGSRHPLSGMLPLSDPSWGIQFQSDDYDGNNSAVNIGWYWARPLPVVREYFVRAHEFWDQTREWDQRVMNRVRFEMMSEGSLAYPASVVLKAIDYTSFLLLRNWAEIYVETDLIDQLRSEGVLIHFTGLGSLYKHFMAKHLGLWFSEEYYTRPIRLLQPENVGGTDTEILIQFALATHIAKACSRTFMWPMSVNSLGDVRRGLGRNERKPPIQIVHVQSVANVVPWVEAPYVHNRARYTNDTLTESRIFVDSATFRSANWITQLINRCATSADVVKLDFNGVRIADLAAAVGMPDIFRNCGLWGCWEDQEICRYYYIRAS
jgi:Nucleotide-diphospho-sugar transferase